MKVIILAGGYGTRISEESQFKPKPMIEIGGKPLLWHIMKIYSHWGFNEFIICAGYKQEFIKQWLSNYYLYSSDVTFDFTEDNRIKVLQEHAEPWRVTVVDTGIGTLTGGRVKRVKEYIGSEPFMLTYGDGVADIDIPELVRTHRQNKKIVTLTGVVPEGRFGMMDLMGDAVVSFREKSEEDGGWINGGFMVCQPEVFEYIEGDDTMFEREPLEQLANEGQLVCYKHYGFWQCMDAMRDKKRLEDLWQSERAPWRLWK